MKIVLAPDSFKESMSARDAALAMDRGVRRALPRAETVLLPIADGGEGTLQTMVFAARGTLYDREVTDPLGGRVVARYGVLGDAATAVVEMAEASGLTLVPAARRDPRLTTTYGTGELIREALGHGVRQLIVAIGGSATNDAGAGALMALGARFLDGSGEPIGFGGGALEGLAHVDLSGLDRRLASVRLRVACDVTNPLYGPRGASATFGPQKGATPAMVETLDAALRRFANVLLRDTGIDVHDVPGGGAAGGLGAALVACGGHLEPGIDLVLDAVGFDEKVRGATALFTGEGRIDAQTAGGKAVSGLVERASRAGVPVVVFAGSILPGYESLYDKGLTSVHGILPRPCSLQEALAEGAANLEQAVEGVARAMRAAAGAAR
jgi:glycerate 2-kinase